LAGTTNSPSRRAFFSCGARHARGVVGFFAFSQRKRNGGAEQICPMRPLSSAQTGWLRRIHFGDLLSRQQPNPLRLQLLLPSSHQSRNLRFPIVCGTALEGMLRDETHGRVATTERTSVSRPASCVSRFFVRSDELDWVCSWPWTTWHDMRSECQALRQKKLETRLA